MRRAGLALCACLAALGLAACGGAGHGSHPVMTPQARAVARANATHEYPAAAPPAQRAPGARGPGQAVAAFARRFINWNSRDVAAVMTHLSRVSIGQARSEMTLAAAETRVDTALSQGQIANRGSVEAVARLAGSQNRYVVVTLEVTTSAASGAYRGLAPAWHLTLATVSALGGAGRRRWVVSGWQPES